MVVTHIELQSEYCRGSGEEYLVIEIACRNDRALTYSFQHPEISDLTAVTLYPAVVVKELQDEMYYFHCGWYTPYIYIFVCCSYRSAVNIKRTL